MAVIEQTKNFQGITVRYTDSVQSWRFTYVEGDTEVSPFESAGETMVLDSSSTIIEVEPTFDDIADRINELGLTIAEND